MPIRSGEQKQKDLVFVATVAIEYGASDSDASLFADWYVMMYQVPKSHVGERMRAHMRKKFDEGQWDRSRSSLSAQLRKAMTRLEQERKEDRDREEPRDDEEANAGPGH